MPQQINVPGFGIVEFPDGMSDDAIAAAIKSNMTTPPASDTAWDMAKSAGSGLASGAIGLAGLLGDIPELGARGIDAATRYIGGKIGVDVPQRAPQESAIGSAAIKRGIEGYTGEFYKPQTTAGEYAKTVGEFVPGMIGGPAGLARRAVTQVLAPGVASEAAGQATKGTASEPYARIAGALAGAVAPSALGRIVSPLPVDPARQAAVNALRQEGVTDLTAGQITGRKPLQYLEAERGRGANLVESQGDQFTAAALRRVGEDANRATPEVIDRAFTRIGRQFDDLAANNTARVDNQLVGDFRAAIDDYNNLVSQPNRVPAVANYLQEAVTAAQRNGGMIPGDVYQSLRSRMEATARGLRANPEAADAIRGLREGLDDAMERSIQASGNVADLGAWREARRQYRNMLVIERAATGAGENAALGIISPAKLREATVGQGRRNYARGGGDFSELARSGVAVMSPLPNSGTPGRISAQNLGAGLSSLLGGAAGAASGGGSEGTMAGMIAGALLPRAVGRAATSRVGRTYLANQRAAPILENMDPGRAAMVAALLASQQQRLEPRR